MPYNCDAITNNDLKKLSVRTPEFGFEEIKNARSVAVPRKVRLFLTRHIFNRAARAMANRDERDFPDRRDVFRNCVPPDIKTLYVSFSRWRWPWQKSRSFISSSPTKDFEHDISFTYIGEANGEHRFRYVTTRQSKTDPANRTVMIGVALLKDNKLGAIHLGFDTELPKHTAGEKKDRYIDLVPNYAEVSLFNAVPKKDFLVMVLG